MGGGESKEEGAGVWEEMKKIDDKEALKKLLPKLYTLCKDLDRFMDAVSVKEIRDYFTAKREGFLFVVSSTLSFLHSQGTADTPALAPEAILGGLNLLQRLLPALTESPEVYRKFLFAPDPAFKLTPAEFFCDAVVSLFFKEKFAVQPSPEKYYVWHSGIAYKSTVHDNEYQYYQNRIALLQLMLIAFSSILYLEHTAAEKHVDPLLFVFCSRQQGTKGKELLCSLLNFGLSYELGSFEIPLFGSATNETTVQLAMYCLQVTCVLLHTKFPTAEAIDQMGSENVFWAARQVITKGDLAAYRGTNCFEEVVGQIADLQDLATLYKGFKNVFDKSIEKNYERDFLKEAMALLVKITKINKHFLDELYLYDYDFNFVLVSACHYISHFAARPGGEGLVYLNLCLLQLYAERREFGIGMNQECKATAAAELAYTQSTYADCFIVFVHDIVMSPAIKLDYLPTNLLAILSNITPYIKRISRYASVCLIDILRHLAEKEDKGSENNINCLTFALLSIKYLVHYHLHGNSKMVLELLENKEVVKKVEKFQGELEEKLDETKEDEGKKESAGIQDYFDVEYLLDIMNYFSQRLDSIPSDNEKRAKIETDSVVGVSKHAPVIVRHTFTWLSNNDAWMPNYIWTVIFYSAVMHYIKAFDTKKIKLFALTKTEDRPATASPAKSAPAAATEKEGKSPAASNKPS